MKTSNMRNLSRWISAAMVALVLTTGCGSDDEPDPTPVTPTPDPDPTPTVSGFSPVTVVAGDTVTISGSDFPSDQSSIKVYFFDGVEATVVSANDSEIIVVVPEDAQNGPISVQIGEDEFPTPAETDVRMDIPRDGLVAFYSFTGNANDESDNSNDGTVNGATLTADRHGNANSAYSFDGVDDYIEVADDASLDLNGALTISAWINLNSINSSSFISKIVYSENTQGFVGYEIGTNGSSNDYTFFLNDGYLETGGENNQTGVWQHLVMAFSGDMLYTYVDGVLIDEKFYNEGVNVNSSSLYIGYDEIQRVTDGLIDDVAIYNRQLSLTEISELYNQTITK